MEKSVKALNILWGLLIGIMVLSVLVLVFSKGGQLLFSVDNSKEAENIAAYNAKLLAFVSDETYTSTEVGLPPVVHTDYKTIFDVISAINLAKDINEQNGYDEKNCLEIKITMNGIVPVGELNFANSSTIPSNTNLIMSYGQKDKDTGEWIHKVEGKIPNNGYNEDGKICKINFTISLY